MKLSHILGLNARTTLYSYPYNTQRGRSIAGSKIQTKRVLKKAQLPVPSLYAIFRSPQDILKLKAEKLPDSFALKPSRGLGGQGIIVIKKRLTTDTWLTTVKKEVSLEDLKLHALDILEGAYSIDNTPDTAFIEEYIGRHKSLYKYSYRGTPDIRVIVFKRVPVMAMLRLPTKESGGRANLHQGAIACGIDITTGITTRAYWHGSEITYKPDTKRKLNGIKIPNWNQILEIAVKCQEAASLGYYGADIVLHPDRGPMVIELNYQPGLEIQLANGAGLRRRLDKVEDINVASAEHGVKIAQALFPGPFANKVREDEGVKTVSVFEDATIRKSDGSRVVIPAKLDTGAWVSSIDKKLAEDYGLLKEDNILWNRTVWSSFGKENRPVVNMTFWLKGRKITTAVSVSSRKGMKRQFLIGRRDLAGYLVKPVK